jgi:8-amino-7-oxononanoate synthase
MGHPDTGDGDVQRHPGPHGIGGYSPSPNDAALPDRDTAPEPRAAAMANGSAGGAVSRETTIGVRVGAGASRLISGTTGEHLRLESELAQWLGVEACLLFSSAYAANLGTIAALAAPGDVLYSDELNHASIIDGCRLSRAEVVVVPHRDVGALEQALAERPTAAGTRWVVTESYFGMDGTSPDLRGLRQLCDKYDAGLIVDEAHALGVFGPQGRGLAAAAGVSADVVVGGFGKAFGLQGGFVAASLAVQRWLWNRARSFVFSTALSPWLCERLRDHLGLVKAAEAARQQLALHARRLEGRLQAAGVPLPAGRHGPVFPIVLGSEERALAAAAALRPLGVLAHAIRPPTVPRGTARIRVTLRADMTEASVERLGSALVRTWAQRDALGAQAPLASLQALDTGTAPKPERRSTIDSEYQRRWIVLGTGTGIGKSFVADALARLLAGQGCAVAGLKPIETGCRTSADGAPVDGDAARLEAVSFHVKHPRPHPLYAFPDAVTPALAARREGQSIDPEAVTSWVDRVRASPAGDPASLVIETAGGVFSPLSASLTNFDLARCLGSAQWVLVAPDRLGVLHEVASTLQAMKSLGRSPDWLVLNAPAQADSSTGTNAAELRLSGVSVPVIELGSDQVAALEPIVARASSPA